MENRKTSNHENFIGTNSLVVRQNRFESEGQLHVELNGSKFKLINYSVFGIGILSDVKVDLGSYLEGVSLNFGSKKISEHTFMVKRVKQSDFGYELGLEIQNQMVPIETILRIKDFNSLVSTMDEKANRFRLLPENFKLSILELAERLKQYESYTIKFEKKEFNNSVEYIESRDSLIEIVSMQIKTELFVTIGELIKFESVLKNDERLKSAFLFFRENLGNFLFQSAFTKRSYDKPRGYAGDFEMMSQIYANDAFSHTLFGSCIEKAVQSFSEPSAVRNRSKYLGDKIISKINKTKGLLNFLSVASGPAEEIRLAMRLLSQADLDRCTFHLLDQDEGALQHAQKTIKQSAMENNKTVNLKLSNLGIKEVITGKLPEDTFDMIYSAGLFDYFSDPIASKAAKQLYKSLKVKSELIIGNFNLATTNWFGMVALFDWTLILRNEADFRRLFAIAGSEISVECESNNVNLFCCINN